jgi:DNA-binding LytR/AlgR family response regulator
MKLTCLVIDDVSLNCEILKDLIRETPQLHLLGCCKDAAEATNVISQTLPDILFLDIKLPGMTGLDFIKTLVKRPLIVITTSYKEFAAEGFELDVFDYIVKPISRQRFAKCCNIFIKVDRNFVRIKLDELLFVEAMEDFVVFHTSNKKFLTRMSMTDCCAMLPSSKFVRAHRSYIVAIDKIDSIGTANLHIQNQKIPIGPQFRTSLMEVLLNKKDMK